MVVLDELAELRESGGGEALVVLEDHLELAPGDLPAALLPVQLAAAVHVLTGLGDGARQRRDEPDLDRRLGGGRWRRREQRGEAKDRDDERAHTHLPGSA